MGRRKGSRHPVTEATAAQVRDLVPWLTRRQLEYWVEKRFIFPAGEPARGHPRTFTDTEKRVLKTMARLVKAGLPAGLAAEAARAAVLMAGDGAVPRVKLGDGIVIEVMDA
jgi:hypothetical protein